MLQIGRITYLLISSICSFFFFFFFFFQENIFAVKADSEECKYFLEHVDIKSEVKPIFLLAATMSEVSEGCEYCTSTHIQTLFSR